MFWQSPRTQCLNMATHVFLLGLCRSKWHLKGILRQSQKNKSGCKISRPLDPTFMPSTSKTSPTTGPHPFKDPRHLMTPPTPSPCHQMDPPVSVLRQPLQTIVDTHFMFIIEPCFVGHHWLQHHQHDLHFAKQNMCSAKKMVLAGHVWNFSSFRCRKISCRMHLLSNNLCNLKQKIAFKVYLILDVDG
jgi:hypothetical protein